MNFDPAPEDFVRMHMETFHDDGSDCYCDDDYVEPLFYEIGSDS